MNVRLDWGESGPELIVPPVMTEAKKLSYAIDGIRSHVSAIGLLLTDKGTDIDDLTEAIRQLVGLRLDWRELLRETEDEQDGNA